jgi:hypothetical protein
MLEPGSGGTGDPTGGEVGGVGGDGVLSFGGVLQASRPNASAIIRMVARGFMPFCKHFRICATVKY